MQGLLGKCAQLRSLWLDGNQIADKGAASIAAGATSHRELAELFLSSNDIGDTGASAFAEVIRESRLAVLDLDGNAITDRGANLLADSIRRRGRPLAEIGLRDNVGITEAGKKKLIDASWAHTSLPKIRLGATEEADGNANE